MPHRFLEKNALYQIQWAAGLKELDWGLGRRWDFHVIDQAGLAEEDSGQDAGRAAGEFTNRLETLGVDYGEVVNFIESTSGQRFSAPGRLGLTIYAVGHSVSDGAQGSIERRHREFRGGRVYQSPRNSRRRLR